MGVTQFMWLTQKYYTLSYQNFGNILEFLNYIKLFEEQINVTKVTMTPNKQILLWLMMALCDVKHFWFLVQIWGMTSDMTTENAQDILLEDEHRKIEKKSDKTSNTIALTYCNFDYQGQKVGGCWHYYKLGYKKDL